MYFVAHIEVDNLPDVSDTDMYSMLSLHFQDLFGEELVLTEYSQSHDSVKDLFRFDLKPEGT